jgi:hypothetical protein
MTDTFSSLKEKFASFSDNQRHERLEQCMEIQLALDECRRVSLLKQQQQQKNKDKNDSVDVESNAKTKTWWNKTGKSTSASASASSQQHEDQLKVSAVKDDSDGASVPKIKLEDSRAGMKISRFYDWGLVNHRAQNAIAEMREKGGTWNSLKPDVTVTATTLNISDGEKDFSENNFSVNDADLKKSSSQPTTCCTMETHAIWACRAMALGCAPDLVELKKCFKDELGTTNPSALHYNDDNSQNENEDLNTFSSSTSSSSCRLAQKKVGDCVMKNWAELNQRTEKRRTS